MAAPTVSMLDGPVRRVALTCDLQRFSLSPDGYRCSQVGNLHWLRLVLGALDEWPLLGVQVQTVGPARDLAALKRQLKSRTVLREYERDAELAWARRYERLLHDVQPGWVEQLLEADLVIGFELPPGLKRALHDQGRPYISFHVHALRFLRDLCLGATTNCPALARRLEQQAVPENEVRLQARRLAAQLHRQPVPALETPAGWPLLIGQTARDSILIHKRRFADWTDFEPRLRRLLQPYAGVVLLEHPYRSDSSDIAQQLRACLDKPVLMTNANAYGLLLRPQPVPLAVTLASSLGVEAQALGLPTHFVLGDPRQRMRVAGLDAGTTAALHHGVLAPAFWRALFASPGAAPEPATASAAPFEFGDNHLRRGLESWSYGQLERGLTGARARKVLFATESLGEAGATALRESAGGAVVPVQGWAAPGGRAPNDLGVDYFVAEPPPGLGPARRFEGGDTWAPLLLRGFYEREHWGVWSAGTQALIRIAVAPSAVKARATLRVGLVLQIFGGLLPRCPVCRIAHTGRTLALLFFRPGTPTTAQIEVQAPVEGPWCDLSLELSDADSPQHLLGHLDARVLGVALLRVELAAEVPPSGSAQPPAEPVLWGLVSADAARGTAQAAAS